MNLALRCRCGGVEGYVASPHVAGRAICYCRDCQAFARFLGKAEQILDRHGGTDIIVTLPRHVRLTMGREQLRCMRLSGKGLLRWYAGCCQTPIGNTPRNPKFSYVGLVRACLPGTPAEVDDAFGRARMAVNTGSANGPVQSTPAAVFFGVLKIIRNVAGARLGGGFRENPFFQPDSGRPVADPQTLSPTQRQALQGDA